RRAGENLLEFLQEFAHVSGANDERWKQPQNMLVRAVDQQPLSQCFLDEKRPVDGQIDSQNQPFAANFADEVESRSQFLDPGAKLRAASANVFDQLAIFHYVQEF